MKRLLMVFSLLCLPLFALSAKIFVDNSNNLAVEGYDVVSYFNNGKPELGIKLYQADWQGATWRFANAENLKKFEAAPEKFAPQYGGYCPWALVEGRLVGGLTNIWAIEDGKLYLFCSHEALQKWKEGGSEVKSKADSNWPKILQKTE